MNNINTLNSNNGNQVVTKNASLISETEIKFDVSVSVSVPAKLNFYKSRSDTNKFITNKFE